MLHLLIRQMSTLHTLKRNSGQLNPHHRNPQLYDHRMSRCMCNYRGAKYNKMETMTAVTKTSWVSSESLIPYADELRIGVHVCAHRYTNSESDTNGEKAGAIRPMTDKQITTLLFPSPDYSSSPPSHTRFPPRAPPFSPPYMLHPESGVPQP